MDHADEHNLAGTVDTDEGRHALLREIVSKVDGFNAAGSDEDIDR